MRKTAYGSADMRQSLSTKKNRLSHIRYTLNCRGHQMWQKWNRSLANHISTQSHTHTHTFDWQPTSRRYRTAEGEPKTKKNLIIHLCTHSTLRLIRFKSEAFLTWEEKKKKDTSHIQLEFRLRLSYKSHSPINRFYFCFVYFFNFCMCSLRSRLWIVNICIYIYMKKSNQ